MDIDKLKTVSVDLSKLSNVGKNEVLKKALYDESVTKVNTNVAIGVLLKTQYNTDISVVEKKIDDVDKNIPRMNAMLKKNGS